MGWRADGGQVMLHELEQTFLSGSEHVIKGAESFAVRHRFSQFGLPTAFIDTRRSGTSHVHCQERVALPQQRPTVRASEFSCLWPHRAQCLVPSMFTHRADQVRWRLMPTPPKQEKELALSLL